MSNKPKKFTRLQALDLAIADVRSAIGASDIDYTEECKLALETLELMRDEIIRHKEKAARRRHQNDRVTYD